MPSRRDVLATLGTGATLGLAGCSSEPCTAAEPQPIQWRQPGGDARNTAADADHTVPAEVAERWRASITDDSDLLAFAGGVVDTGETITVGRTSEGGFRGSIDLRNGDRGTWLPVPQTVATPPVSVSNFTAVAFETDEGSTLRLFNEGLEAGRYALGAPPPTPRAAGTTLFGGDADGAYAYEVTESEERWRHDFGDEEEGGAIPFGPAVDEERAYVTVTSSSDRGIYALDRLTGEIEWSVEGPRPFRDPVRVGSLLFVPVEYELLAFDAETGEPRWSTLTPADRKAFLPPAGTEDQLVVSDAWEIHALDPETGDLGWSVEEKGVGRPIVIGDTVLASGSGSGVVAYDLADGGERWRIKDGLLVAPLGNGVLVRQEGEMAAYTACEN